MDTWEMDPTLKNIHRDVDWKGGWALIDFL
jgi:hypothetical protein